MKKFFVMTRGRTGSTAVIDSLNKSKNILAAQELFIKFEVKNHKDEKLYGLTPRFDIWYESKKCYLSLIQKITGRLHIFRKYFKEIENRSLSKDRKAFGFKVLSHHFEQRPELKQLLLEREYKSIYLTRNVPRQVISGMVAKLRGKYNAHDSENYTDDACYTIDIDEFKSLVEWETKAVENDIALLESSGFKFIEVRYEDFVKNPDAFFTNIFCFLNIPEEKLPESSFSIMIKDLRQTIKNYDQVHQCLIDMGMTLE